MQNSFYFVKKLKFLLFSLVVVFQASLFFAQPDKNSEKNPFEQKIQWEDDENASEYNVEIRNLKTGKTYNFETEENFINLNLSAGVYEYRVTVLNSFGRAQSTSEWSNFEIFQAKTPEIVKTQEKSVVPSGKNEKFSIDVDIKNVNEDSSVSLINEKTNQIVKGELILQESSDGTKALKAEFPKVSNGEWKLRVENPLGQNSESNSIDIVDQKTEEARLAAEKAEQERIKAEQERLAKREEEKRLAEEARIKAEAEEKARLAAIAKAEEEKRIAEELRIQQEKEELARKQEEARLAAEKAEQERIKAEQELFAKREEEKRLAEEARIKAEAEEKARLAAIAKAEEEKRIAEELHIQQEKEELARKQEESRLAAEKAEQERIKAEQERLEKDKKFAKKLESKKNHVKVKRILGFYVAAEGGIFFSPFFDEFSDGEILPFAGLKMGFVPELKNPNRIGLEFDALVSKYNLTTSDYDYSDKFGFLRANILYQRQIYKNILKLNFHAGGNLMFIQNFMDYKDSENIKKDAFYGYAGVQGGTSLVFTAKNLLLEVGADYNYVFIDGMSTDFLSPCVSVGFRW